MTMSRTLTIAAFTGVILFPALTGGRWLGVAVLVLFAVLGAQALNIMIGLMGQVSIGNAAFLAIGGFTAALMVAHTSAGFLTACAVAVLVAALVGGVASLPAFRLRGFYLAVSTIALTYAVLYIVAEIQDHQVGASGFRMPYPDLFGVSIDTDIAWYLLLLPLAAGVTVVFWLTSRSSIGRAAQMIRDHEVIAPAFGISTRWMKTCGFIVSSGLIGLEGALLAFYVGTVHVENYTLLLAIEYLAMVVLGGLGSAIGAVLGAVVITMLPFVLQDLLSAIGGAQLSARTSDLTLIVTGLIVVFFLIRRPGGLVSLPAVWRARFARHRTEETHASEITSAAAQVDSAESLVPPDAVIGVSGLTVTYPNGIVAVRDVSLACARGSITMILGANGAGKSTLLRSLTGFMTSEKVTVTAAHDAFDGAALLGRTPDDLTAAGVVLVPERSKVFPGMTAAENLEVVPRRLVAKPDRFIDRDAVLDLFPRLAAVARTDAALLSGGEKQMLALGRALLTQPSVLVIDELSLGLAPTVVRDLLATIGTIRSSFGVTILMVEEAARGALPHVDRVVMMRHGSLISDRPAAQWSDVVAAGLVASEEEVR